MAAVALCLAAAAEAETVVLAVLEVLAAMAVMAEAVETVEAEAVPSSSLPSVSLLLTGLSWQTAPPGRAALQVPSVGLAPQAAQG